MAGIYIHIPFCKTRCIYCDFYSGTDMSLKEKYVSALIKETELRKDYFGNGQINTVYFGGGTPSQLNTADFERIFESLYNHFTVFDSPEITLEANPDDLTDKYVREIKQLPINRISIGIQSFNDHDLKFLNRRHTAQEAINAVNRCKNAGFDNISIDLMYGLPKQTIQKWENNINEAIKLDIQHISAYSLSYEEGTEIAGLKEKGLIQDIEDELCEKFFYMLEKQLKTAGFAHYEISSFAKISDKYPEGLISRHNSSYWDGTHYLGLGVAAHSYNSETRSWNVSSVADYIKSVDENNKIPCEIEYLDERMKYNDFIITRLRTTKGFSPEELSSYLGDSWKNLFFKQSEHFLKLKMLKKEGGNVKVSCEKMFLTDSIIRDLICLN